ncbi:MAG TPA: discoidin domain-containing protein, partial [Byssovorax sp.]
VSVASSLGGCLVEDALPPPPPPPPPFFAHGARFVAEPRREFATPPREFASPPMRLSPVVEEARASSSFGGWPASFALDGDLQTSWYSAAGDSAALGRAPYFELRLEQPASVHRVVVLGTRDPSYPTGYTVHAGRLELFDAGDQLLLSIDRAGRGPKRDFDFRLRGLDRVAAVRFTSLEDDGDKNPYGDVAIAEMRVE